MFVNRKRELKLLGDAYHDQGAGFYIIYGRRRVGKTELVLNFLKDKPHLYYMGDQRSEQEQTETVKLLLAEYFHDEFIKSIGMRSWDSVFSYLAGKDFGDRKFILALDEFPYIAENSPSVASVLQKYWDLGLKNKNLFIILTGSSVSFMEKELLSYKSPLYGRRTGQMEVRPFTLFEAAELFPGADHEKVFDFYSVAGGIPAYLTKFDSNKSLKENLLKCVLKNDAFLYGEVNFLLMQELRTPRYYMAALRAISLGATKLNDIKNLTGFDRQMLGKYLETLYELRIIKRIIPAFENPLKSRKGLYVIQDNYFRFWFRFINPWLTLIEENRPGMILKVIEEGFQIYRGFIFEDVCRDFIRINSGISGFENDFIGSWWNGKAEIDIVCTGLNGEIAVGECKFTNSKTGINILEDLEKRASLMTQKKIAKYLLFSGSGFTEELLNLKERREDLELISFNEMFSY
ncbi:MAG: ATP-binding protein [Ignavibacteriaceae bacterium]|nr:ATP-binding protein [Ignavibacteriaceae bacterium]